MKKDPQPKKLVLNKQVLRSLTDKQLGNVAGGVGTAPRCKTDSSTQTAWKCLPMCVLETTETICC